MSRPLLALMAAAVALPLIAVETPAVAASAHNLQSGTSTKNPYDSRRSARMKQMQMRREMRHHRRRYY